MTVVKINAITVPPDGGDELARRFAARAGAVDSQDGFEGFELLRPTDDRTTWLVVTRWRDETSFQAWLNSPAFGHGHRQAAAAADQAQSGAGGPHAQRGDHGQPGEPSEAGRPSQDRNQSQPGEPSQSGEPSEAGRPSQAGHPSQPGHPSQAGHPSESKPVAVSSELWSFEIAGGAPGVRS
jgi:heme-degrading monooxygenase HmoA